MTEDRDLDRDACALRERTELLRARVAKVVVGYEEALDRLLACLLVRGHALLEGVPGIGKTLFVRTFASALGLEYRRIQFTPDLMPADITGTDVLEETSEGRRFRFREGPLFGNVVLADEINRATPRTQSALLEAMEEQSVTAGGRTHALPDPFVVFATQNPIEMEGTYPLPEAQLDRFTFKLVLRRPGPEALREVLARTTGARTLVAEPVLDADELLRLRDLVRRVHVPAPVLDYAARLVEATHPGDGASPRVGRYVRFGSSPRGGQAILLGARVGALSAGRLHATAEDVRRVARAALVHRILLDFEAEADGVTADAVVDEILDAVPAATGRARRLGSALAGDGGDARA